MKTNIGVAIRINVRILYLFGVAHYDKKAKLKAGHQDQNHDHEPAEFRIEDDRLQESYLGPDSDTSIVCHVCQHASAMRAQGTEHARRGDTHKLW